MLYSLGKINRSILSNYFKHLITDEIIVTQERLQHIRNNPDTNLNVVVKLALQGEDESLKNSVMTFFRIREKNLKKLINKHKILYNK